MNNSSDNVKMTVEDIVSHFGVSLGTVRSWIASDKLKPIEKDGHGRGGRLWFARGDVSVLVYGVCPCCGGGFKRERLGAVFCGRLCRDRHRRLHKGDTS